ncbi:hypothetical protein EDC01DRAFT_764716 [Geopyxis carbonaria]|nr:hypothetical protein EDC01DRAFT_764716 [Geopyxis carbonaria]
MNLRSIFKYPVATYSTAKFRAGGHPRNRFMEVVAKCITYCFVVLAAVVVLPAVDVVLIFPAQHWPAARRPPPRRRRPERPSFLASFVASWIWPAIRRRRPDRPHFFLPPELILMVSSHLDTLQDLNSLCRTTRATHALLQRDLIRAAAKAALRADNACGARTRTALHWAAAHSDVPLARALLVELRRLGPCAELCSDALVAAPFPEPDRAIITLLLAEAEGWSSRTSHC